MKKNIFLFFFLFSNSFAGIYKAVQLVDSQDRSVYLYFDKHDQDCGDQGYYLYNNILKEYVGEELNILVEAGDFDQNYEVIKEIFSIDIIEQKARLSCLICLGNLINHERYMRCFNDKNIFITNIETRHKIILLSYAIKYFFSQVKSVGLFSELLFSNQDYSFFGVNTDALYQAVKGITFSTIFSLVSFFYDYTCFSYQRVEYNKILQKGLFNFLEKKLQKEIAEIDNKLIELGFSADEINDTDVTDLYANALVNEDRDKVNYINELFVKDELSDIFSVLIEANIIKSIFDASMSVKTAVFAGGSHMENVLFFLTTFFGYKVVQEQNEIFTQDGGGSFSWILD